MGRCERRHHAALAELLLSTAEEPIVENAPGDYYWGCGKDGTGLNRLGEILMETRAILRPARSS
ncbi:MAG: NADAR domain-containing protein [Kiloniellaceae bacterium]